MNKFLTHFSPKFSFSILFWLTFNFSITDFLISWINIFKSSGMLTSKWQRCLQGTTFNHQRVGTAVVKITGFGLGLFCSPRFNLAVIYVYIYIYSGGGGGLGVEKKGPLGLTTVKRSYQLVFLYFNFFSYKLFSETLFAGIYPVTEYLKRNRLYPGQILP